MQIAIAAATRVALAIALMAVAIFLAGPPVHGLVVVGLLLAFLIAAFIVVSGLGPTWRGSPLTAWVASFAVSAVIVVPELVTEPWSGVAREVIWGVVWWAVLAAYLRLLIFLADYFRKRRNGLGGRSTY
jgi:hypothetical protein